MAYRRYFSGRPKSMYFLPSRRRRRARASSFRRRRKRAKVIFQKRDGSAFVKFFRGYRAARNAAAGWTNAGGTVLGGVKPRSKTSMMSSGMPISFF